MKGQLLILFVLVSLLSTLVSCGSGSQSEAKLEISKAFAMTNPYFGGGLMIHGASTNGQQFTIALGSNLEKTIKLENGIWTFVAVGWDGGPAMDKFAGNNQCGIITKDISASTVVDISMNSSNCSLAAFKDAVKLNQFRAVMCGTFSDYNPGTNTYTPVTAATPDSYCQNLPMELRSELSHFKIVAMENINGVISQAFQSSCYSSGTVMGSLPSRRFPFLIKAYKSIEECNANAIKHQSFGFLKGLEAGNPANFDHLVQYQGVSPEFTRLLLPSSISRRGTSLFTQMIPRVLCGASPSLADCFKSPVTDAHVGVEWDNNNSFDRKLLYKGPNATCSGIVTNIGKNFNFKDCQVEDGNVRAHVSRNELLCQDTTNDPVFSDAVDIYSKNNKLYILTPYEIVIYDAKGNRLNSIFLPTHTGYDSLTVKNDGTIFASWQGNIEKFTEILPNTYDNPFTYTGLDDIHDMDFDENNDVLYFSGVSGSLYSLNVSINTTQTPIYSYGLGPIDKLKIAGTDIFVKNGTNIQKHSLTGVGIFTNTPVQTFTFVSLTNFTIENGYLHVTHSTNQISKYDLSFAPIKTNSTAMSNPSGLALIGDSIYQIGGGLKAFNYDVSTANLLSTHTGTCSEAIDLSPFGMSKIITVKTSSTEDLIPIFAEALDILGLRVVANLDNPYYIFRSLQEDDDYIQTGGGRLRRVQESLSSTGILSLIKTHASCTDLKNAVAAGPITPSYNVLDPFEGELFKVNFKISSGSEVIPTYICSATTSAGCGTAANYDLRIEFSVSDSLGVDEKGIFKLACNRALGSYESYELRDANETERELILWNTENSVASRFEEYIFEVESNQIWAGLNKVEKVNNNEFWSRSANTGIDTMGAHGSVSQIQLAGNNLSTRRDGYSGVDLSGLFISADTESASTSFTGSAPKCMSSGNDQVYTGNNISCTFTLVPSAMSKGVNLNLNAFSDLDNATPAIRSIFTISDF